MHLSKRLHKKGYCVFRPKIPEELLEKGKSNILELSHRSAQPIFNHNASTRKNDRKRLQTSIRKNKKNRPLLEFLESFVLSRTNSKLKPSTWVSIRSQEGCQEQAPHTDYVPTSKLQNLTNDADMPLACVFALEDGTKLNVWERSSGLITGKSPMPKRPIRKKIVFLKKGDFLIFRGDTIHAGSAYERENTRVHVYLDNPDVPRQSNKTWLVLNDPKLADVIIP